MRAGDNKNTCANTRIVMDDIVIHVRPQQYYDNSAVDRGSPTHKQHARLPASTSSTLESDASQPTSNDDERATSTCWPPMVVFKRLTQTNEDDSLPYPRERRKVLVVLLACAVSMMANLLALAVIHDSVGRTPLPDLVFAIVPQQEWAWKVGDPMVAVMIVALNLLILCHRHRWVLWRRWLCMLATLYALRVATLSTTQLPASFEDNASSCKPPLNSTQLDVVLGRFVSQLALFGLQGNNDGYLCGDLLFSGHTVQFSITCFMLNAYVPRSWWYVRHTASLAAFVGTVFMIICRSHYTIDIIIAYWLSTLVFSVLHAYVQLPHSLRSESSLSRLWPVYPLRWLEKHTPAGELGNQLEWPLNAPACCVKWVAACNAECENHRQLGESPSTMGVIHCVTGTAKQSPQIA